MTHVGWFLVVFGVWMLSLMYEMKADMKGMKNEIEYFHMNCWTVSDMERYRFQSQIANASIGVKLPEVQEILRLRTK